MSRLHLWAASSGVVFPALLHFADAFVPEVLLLPLVLWVTAVPTAGVVGALCKPIYCPASLGLTCSHHAEFPTVVGFLNL